MLSETGETEIRGLVVDYEDPKEWRFLLKDTVRKHVDFSRTDQNRGVGPPPIQKPYPEGGERIPLTCATDLRGAFPMDLAEAVERRRSRRRFSDVPLSLTELSFLLWATQGIRGRPRPGLVRRTVPSAGARHALETYVYARRVEGLDEGVYRYLPVEHELLTVMKAGDLSWQVADACFGQDFAGNCACTFFWTAIPYRMEWRYGAASAKVIALDAGHVCQNLYLCCEAIGAGTCAIGAYDQQAVDRLLDVDGEDEFAIYIAPVGKLPS